jgi:hypothetical protein
MKTIVKVVFAASVVAMMAAGCSRNNPVAPAAAPEQGKLMFAMDAADNIASGNVTITKGHITQVLPITITGHTGTVAFNGIQVGHWNIQVQLFDDDGVEIYSGTGDAVVHKDQTTTVTIQVNHNTGNLVIQVKVPGLLLWNTLGSDSEVQNSQVGPSGQMVQIHGNVSGSWLGPITDGYTFAYESALYGNAIRLDKDHMIDFDLALEKSGCIEFWYKPDLGPVLEGYFAKVLSTGMPWNSVIDMEFCNSPQIFSAGIDFSVKYLYSQWNLNQFYHLALVWDGDASEPGKMVRFFVDGQEISSGNQNVPDFNKVVSNTTLLLGGPTFTRQNSFCGVIDNLKVWNYPKIDFSDRFNENAQ